MIMRIGNELMAERALQIEFDVTVRLEDIVALNMRMMDTKPVAAGRKRRHIVAVAGFAALVILAPIFVIGCAWKLQGWPEPLGQILREVYFGDPTIITISICIMAGVILAVLTDKNRMRRHFRRIMRRALLQRPGVDKTDKSLPYEAHVILDEMGVESRSLAGEIRFNWTVLQHWNEEGDRLFIVSDSMSGICIPTQSLLPEQLATIRALVDTKLARQEI
jgi:hypothetical protein